MGEVSSSRSLAGEGWMIEDDQETWEFTFKKKKKTRRQNQLGIV